MNRGFCLGTPTALSSPASVDLTTTYAEGQFGEKQKVRLRSTNRPNGDFRAIVPEHMDWNPFPAFPPAARLAVLKGNPELQGSDSYGY